MGDNIITLTKAGNLILTLSFFQWRKLSPEVSVNHSPQALMLVVLGKVSKLHLISAIL